MIGRYIENEHFDPVPEEEWAWSGESDISEADETDFLVQGFSLSGGYTTVYIADSYDEAMEVKKLHEESIWEYRYNFYERNLGYRIITRKKSR